MQSMRKGLFRPDHYLFLLRHAPWRRRAGRLRKARPAARASCRTACAQQHAAVQPAPQPVRSSTPPAQSAPAVSPASENVGKGFLGACLFAIGGAVIQAILINVGVVAAFSGIITYFLAIYGYQKFSGVGNASSKKAIWISIPISLLMITLGTAFGYSFYCANLWGVRVSEAAHLIQQNSALVEAMGEDIMSTLMLWGASVVVSLIRGRKKK